MNEVYFLQMEGYVYRDHRGVLNVLDISQFVQFPVSRLFFIRDVPSDVSRGHHAHRECHQFLFLISGSCSVELFDGAKSEEFELSDGVPGLYIPPKVWGVQKRFSKDAVLAVCASHEYDREDYIDSIDELTRIRNGS